MVLEISWSVYVDSCRILSSTVLLIKNLDVQQQLSYKPDAFHAHTKPL
jgi:hypothetical protein